MISAFPRSKSLRTNPEYDIWQQDKTREGGLILPKRVANLYQAWNQFVEIYSSTETTFAKDKLVAMSGVARNAQIRIGRNEYLAGIWAENLLHGILWRVKHHRIQPPKNDTYQAPSWSWASVNHVISTDFARQLGSTEYMVRIKDMQVQYKVPSNPFGQVVSGFIKLEGATYGANLHWRQNPLPVRKVLQDFVPEIWINAGDGKLIHADGMIYVDELMFPQKGQRELPGRSDLRLLPILRAEIRFTKWSAYLILEPTGSNSSEYKRFGIFYMNCVVSANFLEHNMGFSRAKLAESCQEVVTII
jgi:hypothetical protein